MKFDLQRHAAWPKSFARCCHPYAGRSCFGIWSSEYYCNRTSNFFSLKKIAFTSSQCQDKRDILSKLPPRARRHRWKNSTLTPFPNDDHCFCLRSYSIQTESERHPKGVQYRRVTKSHHHPKKSIVTIVSILLDALIKYSIWQIGFMFVHLKMRVVNRSITNNNDSINTMTRQKSKSSKIEPKIPRGLRGLSITSLASTPSPQTEYDMLKDEATKIEQWWSTPRWQHTKRVYSGKYK